MVFFALGHIAAFAYYNSWGVDYLTIAEPDTGLKFSLSAPLKTMLVALISFFIVFSFVKANLDANKRKYSPNENIRNNNLLIWGGLKDFFVPTVGIIILFILFYFVSAEPQKNMLKKREFNPLLVKTANKDNFLHCVYLVGSIADLYLFAEMDGNIKMIPKSKVETIEFMFKGNPSELGGEPLNLEGMQSFKNLEKAWQDEWKHRCNKNSEFKYFDFKSI